MAMKFNSSDLDRAFDECFKPACVAAGFDLIRLDRNPKAGLIDDTLRVEIRKCHFLVADLTNDNLGAYWEAGYAEGLGKPAIYTCERSHFEDSGTHFDIRNQFTVKWESNALPDASERLAATIRATLPATARLAALSSDPSDGDHNGTFA
jgi:hypothetical protein